jgi:hypothetical protein
MPTGPGTYGRFLAIRVFDFCDFWVHERDITTPLGRVTDDTGVAAEIALAEVENSIGYIVGKKVGVPDGKSIAFRLTGPIVREIDVTVERSSRQGRPLGPPERDAHDGLHDLHSTRLRTHRSANPHRLRRGHLEGR